jgi:mRNA interferase MazF
MKQAGQIILFRFPQTDLEEGKLRPALLLGKLPGDYDDWLICMISAQTGYYIPQLAEIIHEHDSDFAQSGLKVASVIRVGRLAAVEGKVLLGQPAKYRLKDFSVSRTTEVTVILVTMEPQQPFTIVYAPITRTQLRAIKAKDDSLIRRTIEEQLSHEPAVQTRHRKPLKRAVFFEATWELRFGAGNRCRVFYDIAQTQHVVAVLAIGITRGNRLLIGSEEIRL